MYNSYFGFAEPPFENNLDQNFLFLTDDHKEVLAALLYFIKENKAFAILCGDVGTGKTMLLNSFIDRLPASYHPVVISNPSVEFREILDYVAHTLGLETTGRNVLDIIDQVKATLLAAQAEEKYYFLVIDEAHLLSDRSLDDIRLLSNIESHDRKLLQILLVGQYELSYKLQRPQMRQLRQRITINRFLSSMDFEETSRYINHRLKKVGSSYKQCFDADCLPLMYRITDGVPRQINHLCDNALLVCKAEDRNKVTKRIIRKTDKALRSDLIFAPKARQQKRMAPWLQTRVSPLAATCVFAVAFLVVLFFGYRTYVGEMSVPILAHFYHQAPSATDRFRDNKNTDFIDGRKEAAVFQNVIGKRAQGSLHSSAPEAATPSSAYKKPPDTFEALSTASRTYPDVLEVMSSDSEASHRKEAHAEKFSALQTTRHEPSAEDAREDQGSVSPEKAPEEMSEYPSYPKSIAQTEKVAPNTGQTTRDAEKDKLLSPASEVPHPATPATASPIALTPIAQTSHTDESNLVSFAPKKVVVRKGDTLSAIAYRRYRNDSDAAVAAILSANPTITDKNRIYAGQVLVLPETQPKHPSKREPAEEQELEFSIQVCTLLQSTRAVADDYASQLRQRGYPVYVTEMGGKDGSRMYRICIGKYQTEAEAMDAALYFQEKDDTPYVIIKTEAERSALPSENGEHTYQPLEDAINIDAASGSVEQAAP